MKSGTKKKLLGYGIATAVGILIAVIVVVVGLDGGVPGKREMFRLLSDAGTIAGLVLLFTAALVAVSEQGLFRGVGYSVHYLYDRMMPGRSSRRPETYADYVERKSEKKGVSIWRYLILPGVVLLVLGVLFLILFYYG